MSVNLCARVNFRARRVVRNGVAYVGLISSHRTQVNNDGDCKRICAEFVLHPTRGAIGVGMMSEGKLCFGGFAPIDGKVSGALHGELSGHISIWFSSTDCVPVVAGRARAIDCQSPPDDIAEPCYLPRPDGGWDCIYCVDWDTECSIEQEGPDEYPCNALGAPGGGRTVMPSGLTVIPEPGVYDIYGDDGPFQAGAGRTGKVTYHLQDSIRVRVDPLWFDPEFADYCGTCGNWMCIITLAYLDFEAWKLICTDVLKAPQSDSPGACCVTTEGGDSWCEEKTRDDCYEEPNGVWRGVGTVCAFVDCATECYALPYPCGACCLPSGQCAYLTEAECELHGGEFHGAMSQCDGIACGPGGDVNLAAREVQLIFQGPIGWFNAELDRDGRPCWHLYDQYCFSGEPVLDEAGMSPCGYLNPCWENGGDTPLLRSLDTMGIDCNMRHAESDLYPHIEPECVQIANAAFAQVGELLTGLDHADRFAHFDDAKLNRWQQVVTQDCRTAPSIWPVSVIPYKTACVFPADLVVWQISALLYVSGDPANKDAGGYHGDEGKVRVAAVFYCTVRLKVRLQPGWGSIDCAVQLANDPEHPCDPAFVDAEQYMILAGGSCNRVPLELRWKGIQGPRPWSRGPFEYVGGGGTPCCNLVCAMHGLLIPGEVNNTGDPDGMQRYAGDVVLFADQGASLCGCAA